MTVRQALAKAGEKNPMAKLDPTSVRAIRRHAHKKNLRRGWKTKLAQKYDVQVSTIINILSGKSWKHIEQKCTLFEKNGEDNK